MAEISKEKEIFIKTADEIGLLSKISSIITANKINIKAICAYSVSNEAYFMLVTSDNNKAMETLKPLNFEIKEQEVVLVNLKNEIGATEALSKKLAAAGINLKYTYGTAGGKETCLLVFNSNDNDKAIKVLEKFTL